MPKVKGRAKQFADWEEKPAQDYDPEAEPQVDDADSDSDQSVDEDAGAEHYVAVGKSKLRHKDPVSLGPRYRGARVSRDALDLSSDGEAESASDDFESAQEDFDDPDEADLERDQLEHEGEDAEIDSDNAFGESDEERFQGFAFRGNSQPTSAKGKRAGRPVASDFMIDEAEESEDDEGRTLGNIEDSEEDSEDEEDDGGDLSDLDGFIDDGDESGSVGREDISGEEGEDDKGEASEDDTSDDGVEKKPTKKGKRVDLKSMMASGTETVASAFASSVQKDVAKGQAVQQQRKAFDGALNVRIRLQKALVAVNSFGTCNDTEAQSEPYEAAEAAAVKLLNTIGDYRLGMQEKTGQKRKRSLSVDASNKDIWDSIQEVERPAVARRKAVLDNWSKKVKATQTGNSGVSKGSKFTKVDEPLTMLLENQMQDPERLVRRTQVPRSCAPVQASRRINEDVEIYDDADFYQLLLKELVDQRTADSSGAGGQAATIRYAAVKEAKNKKHVDTKASKGRKMRFNVHEKLQNFMAPEDRRNWEQHAIDRFFGTLFGQKMVLNEDEVSDEEMGDVIDVAEEGLRLFRN
ncbi:transcription factor aatf che-1 [Seiridium cupressi]